MNLRMHTLRRTAAVIVRLFFHEVARREMNDEELKKTKKRFGWKSKAKENRLKIFEHYAKDWRNFSLSEMPPVWKGLIKEIYSPKGESEVRTKMKEAII